MPTVDSPTDDVRLERLVLPKGTYPYVIAENPVPDVKTDDNDRTQLTGLARCTLDEPVEGCDENGTPVTFNPVEEGVAVFFSIPLGPFGAKGQDVKDNKSLYPHGIKFLIASLKKAIGIAPVGTFQTEQLAGERVKIATSVETYEGKVRNRAGQFYPIDEDAGASVASFSDNGDGSEGSSSSRRRRGAE